MKYYLLLPFCWLCITQSCLAQQSNFKKWVVPDHYKLHFAGEIGLFSVSVGKDFFKNENVEFDLFLGYLPEEVGGDNITTVALKTAYFPFKYTIPNTEYFIEPFGIGLNFYHALGDNLNKYRDTSIYPPEYYWWPIGIRIAPYISSRIGKHIHKSNLSSIQFYYELGANDLYIFSWYKNRRTFPLYRIFNLSFGLSFKFRSGRN